MKTFILTLFLFASIGLNGQNLTIKIHNTEINGNLLTYDVTVDNFVNMGAMQYGFSYDETALEFVAIENMNLQNLQAYHFNTSTPGYIGNVWVDNILDGVSLNDGTSIYQIVFELIDDNPGEVCFIPLHLIYEFVTVDAELASFTIVDDCHPEPYEIFITVATEDLAATYGLQISTFANNEQVIFMLDEPRVLDFRIFDMSGKMVTAIPNMSYGAGNHTLDLNTSIPSGMYLLTTEIDGQPITMRFIK